MIEVTIKHGKTEGEAGALVALIIARALESDLGVVVPIVGWNKDKHNAARLSRMRVRKTKPTIKVRYGDA